MEERRESGRRKGFVKGFFRGHLKLERLFLSLRSAFVKTVCKNFSVQNFVFLANMREILSAGSKHVRLRENRQAYTNLREKKGFAKTCKNFMS